MRCVEVARGSFCRALFARRGRVPRKLAAVLIDEVPNVSCLDVFAAVSPLCLATTSPSPSPSSTPSSSNQRLKWPLVPFIRCTSSSPTVPLDTVDLLDVDLCQTRNPSSPPTKHPWLVTCMNLRESRRRLVTRQKRGAGPSRCSSQEPRGAASFSRRRTEALCTTRFLSFLFVSFRAHAAKCGDTTSQPHFCCF